MHKPAERGIALVLALLLTSAMSIVGMSLMFLSQTETYATMNYRMMSQARYAGEAAIHRAGDFLMDSTQYAKPGTATDPLGAYDTNGSPVRYNGRPVVLSAMDTVASNYPDAAVQGAFAAAAKGQLSAGNTTLTYGAYATLLSMQQFVGYGGTSVIQTWQIVGVGGIQGSKDATVEVIATIEEPKVNANAYAAFATAEGCGAMTFKGNVSTNSYDSSEGTYDEDSNSGNVGTNGNLTIEGAAANVNGTLSTPREGVGSCDDDGAITAFDGNVTTICPDPESAVPCDQQQGLIKLPKVVDFPTPEFSVIPPTTNVTIGAATVGSPATLCGNLGLTFGAPPAGNCTVSGTVVTVDAGGAEITMPNVYVDGGYTLKIVADSPGQVVNINSIGGASSGVLDIDATGGSGEAVILKVAGLKDDGTEMDTIPFDLGVMDWKQNSTVLHDAAALQIVYGGTKTISMKNGNAEAAALIYAPNAHVELKGNQEFYGSILAKTILAHGNVDFHYDRNLQRSLFVAGNPMASTFSWKRF